MKRKTPMTVKEATAMIARSMRDLDSSFELLEQQVAALGTLGKRDTSLAAHLARVRARLGDARRELATSVGYAERRLELGGAPGSKG